MMENTIRVGWSKQKYQRVIVPVFIFVFYVSTSHAEQIYKRLSGYYKTRGLDSTIATILAPIDDYGYLNYTLLQKELIVETATRNQRVFLPTAISEFGFKYGEKMLTFKTVNRNVWLDASLFFRKNIFLLVKSSFRDAHLYQYFNEPSRYASAMREGLVVEETLLLQGKDKKLIKLNDVGLKRRLRKHFSECTQLLTRIEQGYYHSYTIDFFIKDYSQFCR